MQDKFLQFLGIAKKSGKLLEGYNKCEENLQNTKSVKLCIISDDVSLNTKDKFTRICTRKGIPMLQCYSSIQLGETLGREVINVICVIDGNLSDKLIDLYNSDQNKRG